MRLLIATALAALAVGAWALSASGDEPVQEPEIAAIKKAELPPLPEMRPKVVEPQAGDTAGSAPAEPDPGLTDAGPKPTQPASRGARPGKVGRTDITKAT